MDRFDISPTIVKSPETWRPAKHTDMSYRSMLDLEDRTADSQKLATSNGSLKRMMEDQNIYISTIAIGITILYYI